MSPRQMALFLFVFSFINAVYEIAIIKELSVSIPLRFAVNIIIGLGLFGIAFGSYLGKFVGKKEFEYTGLLNGFAVLSGFFMVLLIPFSFTTDYYQWISTIPLGTVALPPFLTLGIIYASIYSKIVSERKEKTGLLVACSLFGFGAGSLFTALSVNFLTPEVLILSLVPLSLVTLKKYRYRLIFLALALMLVFSACGLTENLRSKEKFFWSDVTDPELVYSEWSRYHKIEIFEYNGNCLAVLYNSLQQFSACRKENYLSEIRGKIYSSFIQEKDEILILGSGSGWGVSTALESGSGSITAVEIDEKIVELFRGDLSEYNGNVYKDPEVKVISQEGRAFLDFTSKKYDVIIFEGTGFTIASVPKSTSIENYLYTIEGLEKCVSSLKENGTLVLMSQAPPHRIVSTLGGLNLESGAFRFNITGYPEVSFYLIATGKNKERVKDISGELNHLDFSEDVFSEMKTVPVVTDDRPFFHLYVEHFTNIFFRIVLLPLLAVFFVVILLANFFKKISFKTPAFFFLVGISFLLLELFVLNKMRYLFGDPVTTVTVGLLLFTSFAAAGSFYSDRLKIKKFPVRFLLLFFLSSVFLLFSLENLPFYSPNFLFKLLFSAAALFPLSFMVGTLFPTGLRGVKPKNVYLAYAADAVGSGMGLLVFMTVSVFYGFFWSFLLFNAFFALALFLILR